MPAPSHLNRMIELSLQHAVMLSKAWFIRFRWVGAQLQLKILQTVVTLPTYWLATIVFPSALLWYVALWILPRSFKPLGTLRAILSEGSYGLQLLTISDLLLHYNFISCFILITSPSDPLLSFRLTNISWYLFPPFWDFCSLCFCAIILSS